MRRLLHHYKIIALFFSFWLAGAVYAYPGEMGNDFYLEKTKVLAQQVSLLEKRLSQSKTELVNLRKQQDTQLTNLSFDKVNKSWLKWISIDISVAKSNLDSINIELSESEQTIALLEKDTQEMENQLNVANVFKLNTAKSGALNAKSLQAQLVYQKQVLSFEKTRLSYLGKLHDVADSTLQLHQERYSRVENFLKSQTLLQLKEQQAKSEIDYQHQQDSWMQRLSQLNKQLQALDKRHTSDKKSYANVLNEIFYANENVSFIYLQMLITRYHDQIQQFKVSLSHSTSISLLNKVGDQSQALSKQFTKVKNLLDTRIEIIQKRKAFLLQQKANDPRFIDQLNELEARYKANVTVVRQLQDDVLAFRNTLEQSLQQELSARQGLLGFGAKAWLDVGNEMVLLPTLTYQAFKSLGQAIITATQTPSLGLWVCFVMAQLLLFAISYYFYHLIGRFLVDVPDHELGHINPKWLLVKLFHRIIGGVTVILSIYGFMSFIGIPAQQFRFLLNLSFVAIFFYGLSTLARLCLIETVHDKAGHDVRLFHRLKWIILVGGVVTACTVFLHQLPLIYEMKDLFYRLFLVIVAIFSFMLLRSWDVLPGILLHYIDEQRTYLRRVFRLLGLLIPLTLLINSLIGVFGFLNFVLTIAWYEGAFLMVLMGYLIVRGVLGELMELSSRLLISHLNNGWLLTEAFLKPIDNVLRISLFLFAWGVLFFIYGWDWQSPVVIKMKNILHYQLFDFLNTSITLMSMLELVVIVAVLYWVGRWSREFVYRFLLSKTKDLGVRNSIAILSQYTLILVGVLIGLRVLGIDLRALTVVAGAFAFGVGLGLRDLANNFACGFLLLLERPLRVGDTVTIGGHEGDVMHIGGRAVTIRTWDHMELLVPNAEIFSKTFINWTAKDHIVRSVATIKIHRHDNPLFIQGLIYETLKTQHNVLADPSPEVYLKELADEQIEFEVRYFVNLRQIKSRISVRSEVLLSIWQTFETHGIKHPYPQHEIHIKGGMPLLSSPIS